MRETWQEIGESIHDIGVKKVAQKLGISASLIYKWCQEPKSEDNPEASGAANPLDRLFGILEMSESLELVQYIARKAGGFYTPNSAATEGEGPTFLSETMGILDKFADMMRFAEQSLSNDGKIDKEEAISLRRDWDKLKSRLESFILACEGGSFDQVKD